jgi:uncharacterized lipoprotein
VRVAGAVIVVLAASAAGCSFGKKSCDKIEEYESSEEIAALQVPADLDEPERSGQFIVPGEQVAEETPPEDQPCLERPPDYFDRKL